MGHNSADAVWKAKFRVTFRSVEVCCRESAWLSGVTAQLTGGFGILGDTMLTQNTEWLLNWNVSTIFR